MANRAFIRFQNITIPNYSEVSNVYARFTSYSDRSDTPVNLRCAFVNEDNPDAPTSYAELQAFSLTAWVSWSSLEGWADGIEYDTPDLTTILQSIIERTGWSSGNSVILIIEDVSSSGQRGFSSIQFDSGSEKTTLFATYTARECSLAVDDSFTGEDGSPPNSQLWYLPPGGFYKLPVIWNNRLNWDSSTAQENSILSTWYSESVLDVQIDWYAGANSGVYFIVLASPTNELDTDRLVVAKWQYLSYGEKLMAVSGYSPKEILQWATPYGKWRISVSRSQVGSVYSSFYLDGNLWHSDSLENYTSYKYLSVFLRFSYSTIEPTPIAGSGAYFDNFVLLSGQPAYKL